MSIEPTAPNGVEDSFSSSPPSDPLSPSLDPLASPDGQGQDKQVQQMQGHQYTAKTIFVGGFSSKVRPFRFSRFSGVSNVPHPLSRFTFVLAPCLLPPLLLLAVRPCIPLGVECAVVGAGVSKGANKGPKCVGGGTNPLFIPPFFFSFFLFSFSVSLLSFCLSVFGFREEGLTRGCGRR